MIECPRDNGHCSIAYRSGLLRRGKLASNDAIYFEGRHFDCKPYYCEKCFVFAAVFVRGRRLDRPLLKRSSGLVESHADTR